MDKIIYQRMERKLSKRIIKEKVFKFLCILCIFLSISFLAFLLTSIVLKGYSAFFKHQIQMEMDFTSYKNEKSVDNIKFSSLIKKSIRSNLNKNIRANKLLARFHKRDIEKYIKKNPEIIGQKVKIWINLSDIFDSYLKGKIAPEELKIFEPYLTEIDKLKNENSIRKTFNFDFFTSADSRYAEEAGILSSVIGSLFTMITFLLISFPIAVMIGFYLEKIAPKNLLIDIIEISINNLAAVPSIIFGLLGLVLYINFFEFPRSSALVGGATLALLTLPIIIITTRSAIRNIPSYVEDAATALGASKMQVIGHYTLPLSLPTIMTGTILAVSRAIGETAPLLMIGMVAFIADIPKKLTDPTSVIPVQIYLWSDNPEIGFVEKTSAAIMILLFFLIIFNSSAIFLRKKFEIKW